MGNGVSGKWGQCAKLDKMQGADFEDGGAASADGEAEAGYLGENREFHHGRVVPSRLPFGKFKGRIYQEAREGAELRSWLEWQGSAASPQAACQNGAKAGCQGELGC